MQTDGSIFITGKNVFSKNELYFNAFWCMIISDIDMVSKEKSEEKRIRRQANEQRTANKEKKYEKKQAEK